MDEKSLKASMKALSASRIKTLETCSWLYWSKYNLKLPNVTNDGARKGEVCHNIFELLLHKKHLDNYKIILKNNTLKASPSIYKLTRKLIKNSGLDATNEEIYQQIHDMILVGLKTDFFVKGGKIIKPEYEFEILNLGPKYLIKGFIDKPAKKGKILIIDDFKSSKKQFSGEDLTTNIQAMMYSLAATKLWPDFKPIVRFIFLQFPNDPIQQIEYNKDILNGFESYLEHVQHIIDNFNEKDALANMAADSNPPASGEFKGKLVCGFAKTPNQMKKNGQPMYYCPFKFPFNYYAVKKEGKILYSVLEKDKSSIKLNQGEEIQLLKYGGCPRFNSHTVDSLHTPVIETKKFINVLDDF